jgi:hypothetical protein
MTRENKRNCYCGLREYHPNILDQDGVPPGFCGFCEICKKPGHTRHFPGASPVTGCWCDRHYRWISIVHPLGFYGKYLLASIIIIIFLLLYVPKLFR